MYIRLFSSNYKAFAKDLNTTSRLEKHLLKSKVLKFNLANANQMCSSFLLRIVMNSNIKPISGWKFEK